MSTDTQLREPETSDELRAGPAARTPGQDVLVVEDLTVTVHNGALQAVHGVSLAVRRGEVVGLVGESGSGKTLTCRAALGILAPGCDVAEGSVSFGGQDTAQFSDKAWRAVRGSRVGAVFQDPGSYLNPSVPVGRQLSEALRSVQNSSRKQAKVRALELLRLVGLRDAESVYRQLPGELSGGMLQRVMIAIAVSGDPELLVADEATTALDVTIQAEIIELILRLRDERGLGVLFVSHDLAVISELCDRVVVFYAGEIVEAGPTEQILLHPRHPYTQAMLRVASLGDYTRRTLDVIEGQPPSVGARLPGCRFADRCGFGTEQCRTSPVAISVEGSHEVRCLRADELNLTRMAS
jgi:peptide/nickel transport system ATP-binding protein